MQMVILKYAVLGEAIVYIESLKSLDRKLMKQIILIRLLNIADQSIGKVLYITALIFGHLVS